MGCRPSALKPRSRSLVWLNQLPAGYRGGGTLITSSSTDVASFLLLPLFTKQPTSRYLPLCLFSSELRRKPCLPTSSQHLGTHLPVKSLPVSLLPTQISDHSLCRGSKGSSWPQLIELLSFYPIVIQSPENPPLHLSGGRRAILETLVMGKWSSHGCHPKGSGSLCINWVRRGTQNIAEKGLYSPLKWVPFSACRGSATITESYGQAKGLVLSEEGEWRGKKGKSYLRRTPSKMKVWRSSVCHWTHQKRPLIYLAIILRFL